MPLNSYNNSTRSVYRLIVTITFVMVLVCSLLIGSIFYWKVLTPIQSEMFAEANKQMRYNLDMRLEAKKDSVISIAQSIVMVKYFRRDFKLLSLKVPCVPQGFDNSVPN